MNGHNFLTTFFTTLALALAPACQTVLADNGKWPLQFDQPDIDFGDINEADGIVSHTFVFSNISDEPVTIDFVTTSCGCTTTSYPTEPLVPGQMYEFTVFFNPARTEGKVYRDIGIFVKGYKECQNMELEANVTPAPIGVRQMYPHVLAGNVRTSFSNIAFGYLALGHSMQKSAVIVNDSDREVRLKAVISTRTDILSVECPTMLGANQAESIIFTFNQPADGRYGTEIDSVWIYADGVRGSVPFVISTILTDDFTNVGDIRPALSIDPTYYDFGQQKAGKVAKKEFQIRNNGEAGLIIRAVEYSEGTTSDLRPGTAVRPGGSVTMTVATAVRGIAGQKATASVNLITNDPIRPRREIRLNVETK